MSLLQFEKKTVGVVLIFCSSGFHGSLHVNYILLQSIASCSFFHESRSHWNPIQCGIYRAIEILQITAIILHKGSYLVRQKIIIEVKAFFLYGYLSIDIGRLISIVTDYRFID